MPSFNQARFLADALESIAGQAYGDWELIIEDGGSHDESPTLIRDFAERHPGKVLWRSSPDDGQSAAINLGLAKARGDILCYLNSDDGFLPNALQCIGDHFANHPNDQLVYGEADYVDEQRNFLKAYPVKSWSYRELQETCFICQPACFWRRKIYEQFGGFDPSLTCAFDYEYWLRIGKTIPFSHLPYKLAFSRYHTEAKSSSLKDRSVEEAYRTVCRYFPGTISPLWARKLSVARASNTFRTSTHNHPGHFIIRYWISMLGCLPNIAMRDYWRWFMMLSPPYRSAIRRIRDPLADLRA